MNPLFDSPQPGLRPNLRARFAVRGLRSALAGVAIALILTGGFGANLWISLVQSISTAVICWFCIDFGRLTVASWRRRQAPPGSLEAESRWPGWPMMVPVVVIGTVIGFSGGNAITEWLTGSQAPGFFRSSWQQSLGALLSALIPGIVITYWFYSRERFAAQEAAVQAARCEAAEYQLRLLESQLEPHMLFNTLANLRVLIGVDPPRAQAMLDQFIAFLRATLNASRSAQQPLSAEFSRLADYLALMQVRMGDRLQTSFDLPAELAELAVPPLLLQPLVENSIMHGLEPKVGGGRVDVSASEERGQLVLRVRDTGVGLAEKSGNGTKFGLEQVRERLTTIYEGRATFQLVNLPPNESAVQPGGTLATIRLPLP